MTEHKNPSLNKYKEFWDGVDQNLSEGTYSGYKVAIIETEKILKMVLDDKKFPGKNTEEQVSNATIVLENPEKLKYARSMYQKIITDPGFDVSEDDTKEILTGYYNSISNIAETEGKDISRKEKMGLFLQRHFKNFPGKSKKILSIIALTFLAIFILTETSTGQAIANAVANFTHFLFYTVLFSVLKLLAIAIIIIGLLHYWQNRKNK